MRRFAWYGRLSTKDKQDPTLSFPSQREACAKKAAELDGRIVCDFTDQEAGRRDDRAGWGELLREAKERDARRFNSVIIYSTSRLSRDLFHALTYEREMTRAGVEVFYALTAGDQTSPEGRLIRHMFQALDQFEVEKLGREVRRGQKENTRQGYRNGGRAPYGYQLRHQPHPDPARARAGDTKSRLVPDPERGPVVAEIFDLFLSGSGYKEIANHLNRPGGPPPPSHVDTRRNASGKWAKSTIKAMLENPTYTGRLFWNRLDSRAHKQGVGPVVRRDRAEWVEAKERHEALISEEQFDRADAEMRRRSGGTVRRRRRPQKRPYLLRGIVHCSTGHNPLRMQGRGRKGEPTYYTCGYRTSYGDRAAEAVGHGKWQYVREDSLVPVVDGFFATRIFGPKRLAHFQAQSSTVADELGHRESDKGKRVADQLGEIERRIERQLSAIEAGVDPVLVGERIRTLKAEREDAQAVISQLEGARRDSTAVDPEDAAAVLASLPDLGKALAGADPEQRRAVFDAFRLQVEIDRNAGQVRLKALVSSAFAEASDLAEFGEAGSPGHSVKAIPLRGFEPRFPD
jgi:DNA invertase Pin-like site-specific DNA recombinase